jgi:hypothetical protein
VAGTRRWLFLALHTLTLFAALLTALPIILHLTTAQSFKLALIAAMALSFPSLASSFRSTTGAAPWRWWWLPCRSVPAAGCCAPGCRQQPCG